MAETPAPLSVVVVDCRPGEQRVSELVLPPLTTVIEAIRAAQLLGDIDPQDPPDPFGRPGQLVARPGRIGHIGRSGSAWSAPLEVAVFNRRCRLDDPVRDGDRIEILRPLRINPKEARRVRAAIRSRPRRAVKPDQA